VQAFVDAVSGATDADSFGTYPGHDPTEDQAVDCFVPVFTVPLGTAIADFAIANMERYGIWYLIFRQRIYNPEIGSYWRDMEDRGSPTQNHFDHVHLSFYATAPADPTPPTPAPTPTPTPVPTAPRKAPDMFLFNHGGGVWLHCGDSTLTLLSTPQVESMLTAGVPSLGDVTDDQFAQITGKAPAPA
jgi:hypothetical protein